MATEGALALEAVGLHKRFGTVEALAGLSFSVRRGELYGLVGADGAGKTTASRALAGLLSPDAGTARVLGRDPVREGSAVRELLGLMPQQFSLYRDLTVAENLQFFARLYVLPRATYVQRRERLLEVTRLGRFLDRRADALSGGMYKKLALACALLHEPAVLLLDEPTNGVDPVSRRELWALLYEFVQEGMTVLVSTPYMDEAERCHRVGLVHRGRLLLEGEPRVLLQRFAHEVYEVHGGERREVDAALAHLPAVQAASPAGARLRVVVTHGEGDAVLRGLAPLGAHLVPARADFEDLFLSRLREEEAS
ncbi:ABC transporter ATP-binding protein [Aggregicoccus sp. 17bor-14]|uniref:ABC transporter ATP-binding protein n=1 Tax=Myxococcaceae TaxID=31 RepID=UPI00129C6E5C|nr:MULTISPECIES: ABC transporter ATP-binding protein [Myxococcaceae]MBF5041608.1 ABC transporter ATP-binding protein [Simulacricoccus sp. 17bor-14]MRI87393.1 ABC transporter ATP-binding protein [Aggregicoccus sp. 17bor-14]